MLLHRVERYLQLHHMTPARFGREVMGDPSFVFDLKNGREPRAGTVARVEAYLAHGEPEHPTMSDKSDRR